MRARDDKAWTEQLTELDADETSRKFRDFLLFWVDAIEKMQVEDPDSSLASIASKALAVAEQTFGYLSMEWIAQMLFVITCHWDRGEELFESLSFIERRLVEQANAMKLVELQQQAANISEEK